MNDWKPARAWGFIALVLSVYLCCCGGSVVAIAAEAQQPPTEAPKSPPADLQALPASSSTVKPADDADPLVRIEYIVGMLLAAVAGFERIYALIRAGREREAAKAIVHGIEAAATVDPKIKELIRIAVEAQDSEMGAVVKAAVHAATKGDAAPEAAKAVQRATTAFDRSGIMKAVPRVSDNGASGAKPGPAVRG